MNRSASDSRSSREALLDAATGEFAQRGRHGARVQAIVKRAGFNERMLYHHFGSKEGLYEAVLEAQWASVASAWQPSLREATSLTPREGLELAFSRFAQVLHDHPLFLNLVMHESMNGWDFAPEVALEQVPSALHDLFRRGVSSGEFRSDIEFHVVYLALIGAMTSRALFASRFTDLRSPGRVHAVGAQTIRLVLDGLAARAGGNPKQGKRRK
jgi:AcrR family transcriptional regulator